MDNIQPFFLAMERQQAEDVARRLAEFLARARECVDIAVYDFHLDGAPADIVKAALAACAARGVQIRLVYDSDTVSYHWEQGDTQRASSSVRFIHDLGYPARAIPDPCCLMHHKYIVLDKGTPNAQVWTGSTNFSNDSWHLQDNNILIIESPDVAAIYAENFDDMWTTGSLEPADKIDSANAVLTYKGQPAPTQIHFAPGQGRWLDHEIAVRIEHAQRQVTIGAGVLTSGHILSALTEAMTHQVPLDGLYDKTQMEGVRVQWEAVPGNHWKIHAFFDTLVSYGNLAGKVTIPWSPTSVHNFMHNKIIVVDDTVVTGSYNFSRNAETNAENVLIIESADLAADYRAYIAQLAARYR